MQEQIRSWPPGHDRNKQIREAGEGWGLTCARKGPETVAPHEPRGVYRE